jgi:hypothetical protein
MKKPIALALSILALATNMLAQNVTDAVVEIKTGLSSIGVGFVWPDEYHVVTALHVVAGRSNIKIRSYAPGKMGTIDVTVEKVLKEADLALLRLSKPLSVKPLDITTAQPSETKRYKIYKLSPGGSKMAGTNVRLESNIETLDFFFGTRAPKLTQSLISQGYPKTSTKIARVIDPVIKGDSGSPICDENGNVIGILDGGLFQGLRTSNWAIIASEYLYQLNSPRNMESFASVKANDPALYLVTDNVEQEKRLTFNNGNVSLRKIFTTTLGDITATLSEEEITETETYYAKIAESTGKYMRNAKIDVYEDEKSGAVIAIPYGFELEFSETETDFFFIQASSKSNKVTLGIALVENPNDEIFDDFNNYVLDLDPVEWDEDLTAREIYEDDRYSSDFYLYTNTYGGEAAVSMKMQINTPYEEYEDDELDEEGYYAEYPNTSFLGMGAFIFDDETVTKEDEYYYALLHECILLSDYPIY